ncbi:hypothetical protein [Arthrobacter methylotrophus]|uniref:hypothetical protein n=1 Tax=Arthrobacter methylotrophus TaxID=121291 RepID=UPI0031ECAF2E
METNTPPLQMPFLKPDPHHLAGIPIMTVDNRFLEQPAVRQRPKRKHRIRRFVFLHAPRNE